MGSDVGWSAGLGDRFRVDGLSVGGNWQQAHKIWYYVYKRDTIHLVGWGCVSGVRDGKSTVIR
jgi:hypothetical protein